MRAMLFLAILSMLALVMAGCTAPGILVPAPEQPAPTSPSPGPVVQGMVQSGGTSTTQGLANAKVTLYEAADGPVTALGSTTTDASGNFEIAAAPASNGIFYLTADLGSGVVLLAVLGPTLPGQVTVNELTTVAGAYAAAQLFGSDGSIQGSPLALQIVAGMNDNLVSVTSGESAQVILSSPNGDETNSLRATRALANLVAAAVQDPKGVAPLLFDLTTPVSGTVPANTIQALVNVARHPARNVEAIYQQSKAVELYQPALDAMPDAWTLAVKVNDSGDDNYLIAGPGNIAFDENGYAWISNNVTQGGTTSGNFAFVLQPNGQPADGTNGTPKSPLLGGGLLGGGMGVAIDLQNTVWFGNFGWGGDNPSPTGDGSVSQFTLQGEPLSGDNGYQGGVIRAQGIAVDADNNIWIASFGNNQLVMFPKGDFNNPISYQASANSQPFDVAVAADGTVWMSNSASSQLGVGASIAKYQLVDGALQQLFDVPVGNSVKGLALDSLGNAWLASGNDNKVYLVNPQGEVVGGFDGGGIDSPWGVAVDGNDNVWVANFGPIEADTNYRPAGVSLLAGANPATRPAGTQTGDPLTPPTGYTLPSAGSPVLLHNGMPLYGEGSPPSYAPLMRQTNVAIDQAGNLWVLNNWKPDFNVDNSTNPGGDGIVIFVGVAIPPAQ